METVILSVPNTKYRPKAFLRTDKVYLTNLPAGDTQIYRKRR
jgi:hypothetical protein